jgi:hypothetical protein
MILPSTIVHLHPDWSLVFSIMRAGNGAATIFVSEQPVQVRFSRFVTSTKYFAGSTSSCSLSS